MHTLKATVRKGRLVLDVATDLPDGQEVQLVLLGDHARDELDDASRRALHASLAHAADDIRDGRLVDGEDVIEALLARNE
jgi:hypothetical protein